MLARTVLEQARIDAQRNRLSAEELRITAMEQLHGFEVPMPADAFERLKTGTGLESNE